MRGHQNAFNSITKIIITPNFITKTIYGLVKINWWIDVTNKIFYLDCDVNVHKRCKNNVAANCGVNSLMIADMLKEMGMNPNTDKLDQLVLKVCSRKLFFMLNHYYFINMNSFRNMELQRPQMQQLTKLQRNRYVLYNRPNKLLWIVSCDYLKPIGQKIQNPKFLFCNQDGYPLCNHKDWKFGI